MERRSPLPTPGEDTTCSATDPADPHTQLKHLIDDLDTPCASALLAVVHTWLETSAGRASTTTGGVVFWLLSGA
jgi:hypothetical protein